MESDIIKISHLNKSFGEVKAVNDLSFRVKKGELFAELIDTIYIHENNEITIKFNFADQNKRLLDFISNNQNTSKKEGRVYTLPSLSKSTLAV